jgi:hypothetical protein
MMRSGGEQKKTSLNVYENVKSLHHHYQMTVKQVAPHP